MPSRLATQIEPTFNGVIHTGPRLTWNGIELHPRIHQALAALAVVAGFATGNHIGPFMQATTAAWHNMIDGELSVDAAAVLAREVIADENLATAELDAWAWPTHKCPQSYDRGHLKSAVSCVEILVPLLQHICLAPKYEHKSSSNVAHVQWFIVLVKYQYGVVHPAEPFGSGLPR